MSAIGRKIRSLVPGAGWMAWYVGPGPDHLFGGTPLVALALVEDESGERNVVGLEGGQFFSLTDEMDEMEEEHFVGYWPAGAEPSKEDRERVVERLRLAAEAALLGARPPSGAQ